LPCMFFSSRVATFLAIFDLLPVIKTATNHAECF